MALRPHDLRWAALVTASAALLGVLLAASASAVSPFLLPALVVAVGFVVATWMRPEIGVAGAGLALTLERVQLPAGLLTPSEAAFALVGGLYLLRLAIAPDTVRQPTLRDLPIWGLIVAIAGGLAVAIEVATSIRLTVIWFVFYLLFLQVQTFDRRQVLIALGGLAAGCAILGVQSALANATGGTALYEGGLYTGDRNVAAFGDANYFACGLALLAGPAAAIALHRPRTHWAFGVAYAMAAAGIVFSLSRGGIIGLAGGLLVLLLWGRARVLLTGVVAVFIALTLFNANPLLRTQQFQTVSTRLGTLTSQDLEATNRRPELWGLAIDLGTQSPVFGVGADQFGIYAGRAGVTERGSPLSNAHNQFFGILAEQGFVGLLSFAVLLGQLGLRAARTLSARLDPLDRALALGLTGSLVGFLLQALTIAPLKVNAIVAGFFVIAGLLTGLADRTAPARGR